MKNREWITKKKEKRLIDWQIGLVVFIKSSSYNLVWFGFYFRQKSCRLFFLQFGYYYIIMLFLCLCWWLVEANCIWYNCWLVLLLFVCYIKRNTYTIDKSRMPLGRNLSFSKYMVIVKYFKDKFSIFFYFSRYSEVWYLLQMERKFVINAV